MTDRVTDTTELDFSKASQESGRSRLSLTVTNTHERAILHVALKPPADWLDLFPNEFALAPGQRQSVVAELRPDLVGTDSLAGAELILYGQFLKVKSAGARGAQAEQESDLHLKIAVHPPKLICPNCGADLHETADISPNADARITECRRCGERIKLCPVCGTPNSWKDRRCRRDESHTLRTQEDWLSTPGGDPAHALAPAQSVGVHLARAWSIPSFPTVRRNATLEWCAPVAAYGIVAAAHIDPAGGKAFVCAYETATGVPLWEFELDDPAGVYPDRGGLSIDHDRIYAGSLSGAVTALDVIRGVRRWEAQTEPGIYGALTATGTLVLVPAGSSLHILDADTGAKRNVLALGGKINAAPAFSADRIFAACDDNSVYAYSSVDGALLWRTETDGPFDASPLATLETVYAASVSGTLYGFDAHSGAVRWTASLGARGTAASPILTSTNLLAVAGEDGYIHLLDPGTGHTVRSKRVAAVPIRCSPASSGGTIFLGAEDGCIYSVDRDFNILRAYETSPGSRIASSSLALYGDLLFVTATNGLLYSLRATS